MGQALDMLGEYSKIISLIPLLIFVLVFLLYILQGLIRGFRKNLILTIISFICFVIAYIIFLCTRSLITNQLLVLLEEQLAELKADMPTITPYIGVIINSILGIGFMIVTLLVWRILYVIAYLFIYLTIFREGKYKKKVNKRYYESMDNPSSDIEVSNVEPYKKRRGFGALLGVFRGLLGGMLAISLFGSIFYLASGTYEPNLKDGEEVILQIDGKDVDLTNVYKFMDDYESINVVAESLKISGVPIYASLPNLYSWSKLVIKEDGINTTVYPYNEVAYVVKIAHTGINIIDKYEIRLDSTNIIDDVSNLLENNENFKTDVTNFINMFGNTKLQRSLGRTITNNFAKIVQDAGKSNEYFDTIFTGENAINIADLASKDDIATFLNIAQKALVIYDDYSTTKDILDVIVNSSKDVTDLTNEILKLTIFNSEKSESLNPLISDLLETALANNSMFKGLKLEDIDWIKNGSADGEIETFVKCLNKFLETSFLTYDGEIKLSFNNFEKLFDSTNNTSVMDDISSSKALRCVLTSVLKNTKVSGSDIYIPDTSLDTSGIIKADEFKELFDSVGEIIEKTDFTTLEPLTISEISDNILPLVLESASEDKLLASAIVSSDILASIMSKIAYETLNEKYPGAIVDELVLDDEHISENMPNWIGKDGELAIFLNIACDLYSEEVITYNGQIEFNLSNLSKVTTDTSYLITDAPRSLLLRGMLVELTNSLIGDAISLVFPEESYNLTGSVKLLTESELRALLKSVAFIANSIDLEAGLDTSQMADKFIDVIKTSDNIDRLSGSAIIEATVSKLLYDSLSETTYLQTIPDNLKLDSEHFDDNIKNWYGEGKEFSKAIKALREILKSEIVEVTLSPNVSVDTNINNVSNLFNGQAVEPIDIILESQILLTMVSGVVEDLNIGYELYLPTEVYENNNISPLEIKKLLKACNLLLSSNIDFNSPTISDDIKSALNEICSIDSNKDLIIDSTIMSGTLSLAIYKILVDMSSSTITFNIPTDLVLDDANKETNISNWMGNDNELRKILDSLSVVDLTSVNNIDFVFKLSQENVNVISNSKIVASTITSTVDSLDISGMEIVVVDEAYDVNGNISSSELYNTISAIKVIVGYNDLTEEEKNNFSFDTINIEIGEILNDQAKVDAIFTSLVIQATIAYNAYTTTKDTLSVPTELVLESPDSQNMLNWITTSDGINKELYYIVDGLRLLGIADKISSETFELNATDVISSLVTDKTDIEIETNINDLLLSKIIHKTVSKILIDMSQDSTNNINVPTLVVEGDYITKSELVNLFLGINAAGLTTLDNIDSVDFIFKMSQEDVDALCNSLIIASTITTKVDTLSMDEMKIVLVDEAYDTNGNISSSELYNIINVIKVFVGYDDLTEEEKNNFSFDTISIDVGEILNDQAKVDAIFTSLIIQATVAYKAYSLTKDILEVPTELVLESEDSQNMANWINTSDGVNKELYYIIDGLRLLGIADKINSETFELNATDVISSLVTGKTDNEIETNINTLLSSMIIHKTMSKIIIDNGNSTSMISVPASVVEGDYITKEELVSLFIGINAAGLTNIDDVDANVIITNDIDTTKVLQSGILWYTFSTTILNTAEITVPTIVKETKDTEVYITKDEITSLINTIKAMDISDFANIDVNKILNLTDENLNIVLNSIIVWYMISDNVFDVEVANTIKIPSISKGSDFYGDKYITKEEIINLIKAVNAFGVSDVNSIDPNILVTSETVNITVICKSDIVRYTISDNIINCGISPSTYSYDDKDASELFIKTTEIENTIKALRAFGLTSIDTIVIDNSQFLSLYSDGEKLDTLLASYIIYREVSTQICNTSGIDVPEDVIKNPGDLTLDTLEKYITKTEIKALLIALNKLGISDLASYEVSNKIFNLGSELSTCLESHIIWYAFSKEIKASSELIVVSSAYDTKYTNYIRTDQITGLINVLTSLSASPSLSSVSFDPASIVSNGLADDISENIILNATISNIILYENMVRTIYDLECLETTTYNDSSYVMFKSAELENVINGLAVLGISDVDGFSFSLSDLKSLSDEDLNTVLNSYTLWLYASDVIKGYVALIPEGVRPTLETTSEMVYKYDGTNFNKVSDNIITKEQIMSYV